MKIPLKNFKNFFNDHNKLNEANIPNVEIENGKSINNNYDKIEKLTKNLCEKIQKLYEKKNKFLEKIKNNRQNTQNNCVIHFCAFIDFLYHEITNQKFIGNTSLKNFPYARFSLIFRSTFDMIVTVIFINDNARNNFIDKLSIEKLENEIITKKITFIDLKDQNDNVAPGNFISIDTITNSIFYRTSDNVHGYFTCEIENQTPNHKKIIQIFRNDFINLFDSTYKKICEKLEINTYKKIDNEKLLFF